MPSKEVVTFWLVMSAPMSLLSDPVRPFVLRVARPVKSAGGRAGWRRAQILSSQPSSRARRSFPRRRRSASPARRRSATSCRRRASRLSLKPSVAYRVLNFCAAWKKQMTLPSLAYAGIPYQVGARGAGALAFTRACSRSAMARSGFQHLGDLREHVGSRRPPWQRAGAAFAAAFCSLAALLHRGLFRRPRTRACSWSDFCVSLHLGSSRADCLIGRLLMVGSRRGRGFSEACSPLRWSRTSRARAAHGACSTGSAGPRRPSIWK